MDEIPTVAVGELAPPRSLADAFSGWNGFAEIVPASVGTVSLPYLLLRDSPEENWALERMPDYKLPAIGCSFLRDVELSGSGYLFQNGRFVREFVNISDAALRWLGQPDVDDNPLVRSRTRRVVIDEPVMMVFGPGWGTYGHWLLDFLPRIFIAQQLLGAAFGAFVLPLPSDAPEWVSQMLHVFCGIEPGRIRFYSRYDDLVVCRRVCLPSYAHDGMYLPHRLMRAFYEQFGRPGADRVKRRICISRGALEARGGGSGRIFEGRRMLEEMAVARGYEIAYPEALSFPDQVELFRSASCILGEHGSGMHGAVFADPGTIVGVVRAPQRAHQLKIAAGFDHRFICMNRIQVTEGTLIDPTRFTATEDDLSSLLAMIDHVEEGQTLNV